MSAVAAIFFTRGILSSSLICSSLVSGSFCSFSAKSSRSNSSCWHGVRNVYTCPVARSNSKKIP